MDAGINPPKPSEKPATTTIRVALNVGGKLQRVVLITRICHPPFPLFTGEAQHSKPSFRVDLQLRVVVRIHATRGPASNPRASALSTPCRHPGMPNHRKPHAEEPETCLGESRALAAFGHSRRCETHAVHLPRWLRVRSLRHLHVTEQLQGPWRRQAGPSSR